MFIYFKDSAAGALSKIQQKGVNIEVTTGKREVDELVFDDSCLSSVMSEREGRLHGLLS